MSQVTGSANNEIQESAEVSEQAKAKIDSVERGETDTVAYSSYQRAVEREKRAKEEARQKDLELQKYREAEKAKEEQKLTEQQEWKKLAKTKDEELKALSNELASLKKNMVNGERRKALIEALGGVKNDRYLEFANLDMIEMVDGQPDPHAVKLVAEDFKKNFPDLLAAPTKQARMTSRAATSGETLEGYDLSNEADRTEVLNSIF